MRRWSVPVKSVSSSNLTRNVREVDRAVLDGIDDTYKRVVVDGDR
jgi:hypothetical protein